jgi:signal transduction histidine kinase/DNA-binding response OmpR family regulator
LPNNNFGIRLTSYVEFKNKLIQEGHLTNIEGTMIAKDGQRIPVLLNSKAIYDHKGNYTHNITVIYNYTKRKKLEQDLLDAHKDADNAHQFKKLFMANMSHEIRTPLNAILGFAHFLGRVELPPDAKEFVRGIQISGANLLGIVNDILDFEKIRSGMFRIEHTEFDLPGLLHSVVTMVRPSAEEKGLNLIFVPDPELPTILVGDPMRLTQILINLLSNAIKFTETGHVHLRVKAFPGAIPDDRINIRFEVEDTGIGIDLSDQQRIFERFVQAGNDTTRKFGGTGLGLALVKMMVELQNGTTTLVSALGQGSTFAVEITYQLIPIGNSSNAIERVDQNSLPDLSGYHVLLVEDNPMNRRIAELSLNQFGLQVTHAEDGLEAIAYLKENPHAFDLVFMDIQMPKMDGYAATKAIRYELELIHLPIVAMTAHVLTGEREKVLACGMNDYLTKPVNQKELATILQKYIGSFWDVQAVNGIVGNNAGNFREIAQLFIRQFPQDLAALHNYLLQGDINAVIDTAHNLRSTVGYAGFQKSLGATLLRLEEEARKEFPDTELMLKLYTNLVENKDKAMSVLQHVMQQLLENQPVKNNPLKLTLADDDRDDLLLFKLALTELGISTQLTSVKNGEQLIQNLHENLENLPDILFLDLNMPRKNGFQCLGEIKQDERLKNIPVVIYSTSYQKEVVNMLYNNGAHHYIQKNNDFALVKQAIHQAIVSITQNALTQPPREKFVLTFEP